MHRVIRFNDLGIQVALLYKPGSDSENTTMLFQWLVIDYYTIIYIHDTCSIYIYTYINIHMCTFVYTSSKQMSMVFFLHVRHGGFGHSPSRRSQPALVTMPTYNDWSKVRQCFCCESSLDVSQTCLFFVSQC